MSEQYISQWSGAQIDRAVAVANNYMSKEVVAVVVTANDWTGNTAPYSLTITLGGDQQLQNALTSSTDFAYPPIVYFLDEDGQKWDLSYDFLVNNTNNTIVCYSNVKKSGTIVAVGVRSGT